MPFLRRRYFVPVGFKQPSIQAMLRTECSIAHATAQTSQELPESSANRSCFSVGFRKPGVTCWSLDKRRSNLLLILSKPEEATLTFCLIVLYYISNNLVPRCATLFLCAFHLLLPLLLTNNTETLYLSFLFICSVLTSKSISEKHPIRFSERCFEEKFFPKWRF